MYRAAVDYEEFLTVVIEIEGIMNSRPLTYINSDVEEILTPGHLLIGKRILDENKNEIGEEQSDRVKLSRRAKYLKELTDHYWSRWRKEYLVELRSSHIQNQENSTCIQVGEVVVVQEKTKRNFWRLGLVVKLLNGADEKTRAVVLKTCKNGRTIYINRPIEKIHPLELRSTEIVTDDDIRESEIEKHEPESDNVTINEQNERPRRTAAENGMLIRRLLGYS